MNTKRAFVSSLLSVGLVLGSISLAHADSTSPSPTPVATTSPVATTYAEQLAAYKVALAAYQIAMDQYRAAWKIAMDQYDSALKSATTLFQAAQIARKAKRDAINATFQATIAKARSDKKLADASATSVDLKSAAQAILASAISTAAIIRQNSLDALGPELVRPVLPAKPVKTAEPVKPTPPVKSAAIVKPTPTAKISKVKPSNTKKVEKNN